MQAGTVIAAIAVLAMPPSESISSAQMLRPNPRMAIVTDASCDVPAAERSGEVTWRLLPETWATGNDHGVDDISANREMTSRALRPEGDLQLTAPTVEAFRNTYAELTDVDVVWSVHSAAEASPAVAAAREAAAGFDNVRVVETNVAGLGTGLIAARLRDLIEESTPLGSVEAWVEHHRQHVHFVAVPDRLDPARSRRAHATIMLSGRHVTAAPGASVAPAGRLRSRRHIVAEIQRMLEHGSPADRAIRVAVGHGDAAGAVDPLLDIIERVRPQAHVTMVGRVGPRLVSSIGSRAVAFAWIVE